jgi:nucleoside-diphosphate-sugar epimerase
VYGTGQSDQFLIPSLISQVSTKKEIYVKDLEPKRDYLYVDDLIKAIVKAVNYQGKFDIFNIGSGISCSVKELIDIIQSCAGTDLPVFSESARRKNEIMDTIADISHAKEVLKWQPERSLEDGIRLIINN